MRTGIHKVDMKNILRLIQPFLSVSTSTKIPLLTPGEITKLSWSRIIKSYSEVPEIYQRTFRSLTEKAGSFPYTVFIPTYGRFLRRDDGKLLCSLEGQIVLLESERKQVTTTCYCKNDISFLEVGGILLQGWVTIRGMAGGHLTSSTVVFNRVNDYLFTPFLNQIRNGADPGADIDLELERCKFNDLLEVNYKFMNFGRKSILPGEQVLQTLFQPEIREEVVRVFGRSFYRTVSPAHLAILTDRELILIREENLATWRGKTGYGGIWNYIPLNKILGMSLKPTEDHLLVLSIHLPGDDRIDTLFSEAKKPELNLFLNQSSPNRKAEPRNLDPALPFTPGY